MNAAFVLATAAWLSGGEPAPAPAMAAPPTVSAPLPAAPLSSAPEMHSSGASCAGGDCGGGCSEASAPAKMGFLDRLREAFGKGKNHEEACDSCCGGEVTGHIAAYPSTTMPHATMTPAPTISEPPPVTLPAAPVSPPMPPAEPITKSREDPGSQMPPGASGPEARHPFELSHRYEKRVESAADFSKITGQLFFVHAGGGLWVLRYAPVGHEDQNGGGVILAREHQMDSYREGDLVTVRGSILDPKRSMYLGAPLYRANAIELVDRGE